MQFTYCFQKKYNKIIIHIVRCRSFEARSLRITQLPMRDIFHYLSKVFEFYVYSPRQPSAYWTTGVSNINVSLGLSNTLNTCLVVRKRVTLSHYGDLCFSGRITVTAVINEILCRFVSRERTDSPTDPRYVGQLKLKDIEDSFKSPVRFGSADLRR